MKLHGALRFLPFLMLFAAGFGLGFVSRSIRSPVGNVKPDSDYEVRLESGVFTNPLLECEIGQYAPGRRELHFFKKELKALIKDIEEQADVEQVAVYFRDLNNGPWIGIKEEKRFTPSSLFKVPLVIGCLKQAEGDPGFLGREIRFDGLSTPLLAAQVYPPKEKLEVGKSYTVRQLMEWSVVNSDNGAAELLYKNIDWDTMRQVLLDLGLDPAEVLGSERTLSAASYGRFFRILYNASYLSRRDSEMLLEMFARSSFRDGLVAGVPEGVVVSHKFGERGERPGSGKLIQFHDCGIVYHPTRPDLLCVMTEGYQFHGLTSAIADVSRFIYEEVSRQEEGAGSP